MSSSPHSVPVDADSDSRGAQDASSFSSSSVHTSPDPSDAVPAEPTVEPIATVPIIACDTVAETFSAHDSASETAAPDPAEKPQMTVADLMTAGPSDNAPTAFQYAYEYVANDVFTTNTPPPPQPAEADADATGKETDPYAYPAADVNETPFQKLGLDAGETFASVEKPPADALQAAETMPSPPIPPVEKRRVSLRTTTAHAVDGASPLNTEEAVRRRSFSSSPYLPSSPMMPLTAREAGLLELLEGALQLTNTLSQALERLEHDGKAKQTRKRKPVDSGMATMTTNASGAAPEKGPSSSRQEATATPQRQDGGTSAAAARRSRSAHDAGHHGTSHVTSASAIDTPHRCSCAACSAEISTDETPNRTATAAPQHTSYAVSGRWEAQLRQPDPVPRRHRHASAGAYRTHPVSSTAQPRPVHRQASSHHSHQEEETPIARRVAAGTYPFTSRVPARVPVNATSRFAVSKEKRPVSRPDRQTSEAATAAPSDSSCAHRGPSRSAHRDPAEGLGRGENEENGAPPSSACAGTVRAHSRGQDDGTRCTPSRHHRQSHSNAHHRHHHACAQVEGSALPSRAPPTAPAPAALSSVGSEYDYCLRQLREDYWDQSHQVLKQLENMLRHGE